MSFSVIIQAPRLGSNVVITPMSGSPSGGDFVTVQQVSGSSNQHWTIDQDTGIPGVFTIASKTAPTLFLTAPPNPKNGDKLTLAVKIKGVGQSSQQQLWRLIPSGNGTGSQAVSMIQNYTVTANRCIDVKDGKIGSALQMFDRKDNSNQGFYIDLVDEGTP